MYLHSSAGARGDKVGEDTREEEQKTAKKLWSAEEIARLENEDGRSLLHVAAAAGHLEAVEFLLRAGADLLKADEVRRISTLPSDCLRSLRTPAHPKAYTVHVSLRISMHTPVHSRLPIHAYSRHMRIGADRLLLLWSLSSSVFCFRGKMS